MWLSGDWSFRGVGVPERNGCVQPPQNSSPGSLVNPHEAQTIASGAAHFEQKRRASRFSV